MGSGPCGRQAASVVASAIRSPSLHVCLACLILCDSEGNRGGGGGVSRLGGACDRGVLGSLRHVKQKPALDSVNVIIFSSQVSEV